MKKEKTYAVFGLGIYGMAVAKELVASGREVLAVDINQHIVDEAAMYLPVCKCADVTEPEVITRLGVRNVDTVILSMSHNLESTIMAATLCKEAGVETVIAKASNSMHKKILARVGADRVVFPEMESGVRLAQNLVSSRIIDILSLSRDMSVVEVDVKDAWIGKTLQELNLRKKYGFNVVAIKKGEDVEVNVSPEEKLAAGTKMLIIGNTEKLRDL